MTTPFPGRSSFDPRTETPEPPALNDHWRKHPSDYHADCATERLIASLNEPDGLREQNKIRQAQVYATLSLRDAVLEATATLRESINQITDPKE